MAERMSSALVAQRDVKARASCLSVARRMRASRFVIAAACRDVCVIHSSRADTVRKVLEFIFQGMVAQKTVTLLVRLSRHMRSSALAVGFLSQRTVPSSVSSTSTNPWLRAKSWNALSFSIAISVYAQSSLALVRFRECFELASTQTTRDERLYHFGMACGGGEKHSRNLTSARLD